METQSIIDRFNNWMKESIMIKLLAIGFMILILLIPTAWVTDIMEERQSRATEVMGEVSEKWSGNQTLAGPVLVIPYKRIEKVELPNNRGTELSEVTDYAFFLPVSLKVTGDIAPQILHRGIFDVAVYESKLNIEASFAKPDFSTFNIPENMILWGEARIASGISDLRGIADNPVFTNGGKNLSVEPTNNTLFNYFTTGKGNESMTGSSGVEAALGWKSSDDFNGNVSIHLALKGSSILRFLPVGKSTEVNLRGPWPSPSFEGEFLPVAREITDNGFDAVWKVLHFNRPFAQAWIGTGKTFEKYDLSTRLIIQADQYQKSIRTAKYGVLLILLSFIALLMVEIIRKIRIHPFQYILIGVALVVYYSLLLSLSEHVGYDIAYLISSIATVILVTLYAKSFLPDVRILSLLSGIISFFYGFIFVIIQAQDFSLLIGSIGLFAVIASIMYFSRSINWYGDTTTR